MSKFCGEAYFFYKQESLIEVQSVSTFNPKQGNGGFRIYPYLFISYLLKSLHFLQLCGLL